MACNKRSINKKTKKETTKKEILLHLNNKENGREKSETLTEWETKYSN